MTKDPALLGEVDRLLEIARAQLADYNGDGFLNWRYLNEGAEIGDGAKVPHLSYVGDAEIGEGTNVGAGTIFANYDGVAKHHTTIGSHARTGADNMFVAPVTVGDGAYTAAGSVITEDVPPGAMGVARARQRTVAGWVGRRRPGTPAAEAADAATAAAAPDAGSPADDHQGPLS